MKLTHFYCLNLLLSLLVIFPAVNAQLSCDPLFNIFCTGSQDEIFKLFDNFLSTVPDSPSSAQKTVANGQPLDASHTQLYQRDDDGCPVQQRPLCPGRQPKKSLVNDIARYFKVYADSIRMIMQGNVAKGTFQQLKNAGSWCDNENLFVQSVIEGMTFATGGVAGVICECMYATLKPYENLHQLQMAVLCEGTDILASTCPIASRLSIAKQLQGMLRPVDEASEAYKSRLCSSYMSVKEKNCGAK